MSLNELIQPFYWQKYGKKVTNKLKNLNFIGFFSAKVAEMKNMRLVTASDGSIEESSMIKFYLLVDETDGVIADIKFQAFGPTTLICFAESFCALVLRKNYDQVSRITADLIEQSLQDKSTVKVFINDSIVYLNQVINTIDQIVHGCLDIPFKSEYINTPISLDFEENIIENFKTLANDVKQKIIEDVLDEEIRPFVELDAGGVVIKEINGLNIFISYEGNCTSCHAATGATLNAIQKILKAKIHPDINVSAVL
jgi:NifU-like protein